MIIYLAITCVILGGLYLLGPRLDLNVEIKTINLPNDLDKYLQQKESLFNDIKPDTEKKILWADAKHKKPTQVALVYLHGFSASRQEISPLLENMAEEMSANIYFSRLVGHARSNDAMAEVTLNGMLNDAIEALEIGKRIGEQVVLIGNSTGSTLITWLSATQNMDHVSSLVLLSPNYGLKSKDSKLLELPWAKKLVPLFVAPTYEFTPENEIQEKYWTYQYPIKALFPLTALVLLTNKVAFEKIKLPLLMMYSEEDRVVDVSKIKKAFQKFGSPDKNLVNVKNVQGKQSHVLAGDALSPASTAFVRGVIEKFIGRQRSK